MSSTQLLVEIDYEISDRVWIPELKRPGVVVAIFIGDTGIQYSVRYFYDGAPHTVYFYSTELETHRASES